MRSRILAIFETTLALLLMAAVFRLVRPVGQGSSPYRFLEYALMLVLTLGGLLLSRRDMAAFGVSFRNVKGNFSIFAAAFFPLLAVSAVLSQVDWSIWGGALLVSSLALAMLFLLAWLLKKSPSPGQMGGMAAGLALAPWMFVPEPGSKVSQALLSVVYFYFFVAPAEEIFFRGYIQSRLNQVFGRPYLFSGVSWGWGWIIASLLFGLWHVIWNPFALAGWLHGLWTFFVGLLFGYVREKSGSVMAPAWLHGVLNYSPVAFILDLFV
ncbi:MAG: CPBP family intramembrane metalloprotease [Anaerolineales bacterium]|nr:CPBP family intramembrane metalloprotease [Anaerolineales bacterium]